MKRGEWKKSVPHSQPDGVTTNRMGRLVVRNRAYMKHLHDAQTPPLDLRAETGEPHPSGPLELHHTVHPDRAERRDNDAGVVPLLKTDHEWVEMHPTEERNLNRLFGVWSAFSFFCYQHEIDPESPDAGQRFLLWVITRLETECINITES